MLACKNATNYIITEVKFSYYDEMIIV